MKSWLYRHRRFLLASATFWLLVLLLLGLYVFIVRAGMEKRVMEGLAAPSVTVGLVANLRETDCKIRILFTILTMAYVLFTFLYSFRRLAWKIRYALLLFLFCYLAFESLVSPRLKKTFGLDTFYAVRNPDHRPVARNNLKAKEGRSWRSTGWNKDAIRCEWESTEFSKEGLNIIFLGDSFTFGYGLYPDQVFPKKVERMLSERFPDRDVRVANFGWGSSSPILSLRRLKDMGSKYKPDFVALCLDMTDFYDDIKWLNQLERRGVYWFYDKIPFTLKTLKVFVPPLFVALFRWSNSNMPNSYYFISEQPLEQSRPFLEPMVDHIAEIDRCAQELGARFILFVLPRSYQYSDRESPKSWEKDSYTPLGPYALEPFRFFDELKGKVDYPVYSLLKDFQETDVFPTCFEHDPHWNDAGATVAAKAITRFMVEEINR